MSEIGEREWIKEQLDLAIEESRDYKQKALLLGTKKIIEEQYTRIEQMQGEVDGTMWSTKKWRD